MPGKEWVGFIRLSVALMLMAAYVAAADDASARWDDPDADGVRELVIENDFLRLVFKPARGGRCSSFLYKNAGKELTAWPQNGAFEDRIWEVKGYDLPNAAYEGKVAEKGGDRAVVDLTTRAQSPGYTQLHVRRRVTLTRASSAARVEYTFTNEGDEMIPVGFWVFNDFAIA